MVGAYLVEAAWNCWRTKSEEWKPALATLGAVLLAGIFFFYGRRWQASPPPPELSAVPDFTLTERSERPGGFARLARETVQAVRGVARRRSEGDDAIGGTPLVPLSIPEHLALRGRP